MSKGQYICEDCLVENKKVTPSKNSQRVSKHHLKILEHPMLVIPKI